MRAFHLTLASLTFITFLLTGLYMRFGLGEVELADRVFYRSRHIYILLAALIHAGLGAYLRTVRGHRRLQVAGSGLLTASTVGLVVAFFTEGSTTELRSPVSTLAIYALPVGCLCHVVANLLAEKCAD